MLQARGNRVQGLASKSVQGRGGWALAARCPPLLSLRICYAIGTPVSIFFSFPTKHRVGCPQIRATSSLGTGSACHLSGYLFVKFVVYKTVIEIFDLQLASIAG